MYRSSPGRLELVPALMEVFVALGFFPSERDLLLRSCSSHCFNTFHVQFNYIVVLFKLQTKQEEMLGECCRINQSLHGGGG